MSLSDVKVSPEISRLANDQTYQLTALEASHVYAILKSTMEKLALVGVITIDPKTQAQELTQSVGEEITRMIQEQKKLETRFEQLVSAQHTLRHLPNKSKLRENQSELQKVAEALRQSTKLLCRNLRDNPNVAENMVKVASERQALQVLLSNCLTELEGYQRVVPVVESVMAQEASEVQMRETIEHERTTTTAVRQLRSDLKDEKVDHEERMREKKKTAAVLSEELKQLKMDTAVKIRYDAKDRTAKNEHERRLEQTVLAEMRAELSLVRQQIEIEHAVAATSAEFLKKMATHLQEESVRWSSLHDDDLSSKDRDLEQLKVQHARDSAKLREMEQKHTLELSLKRDRENKAAEESEQAEMEQLRQQRMVDAAITIQAAWRGHMVRTGGGGKGGKKGGKGAKKGGAKKKK